jgi:hypothetical protein
MLEQPGNRGSPSLFFSSEAIGILSPAVLKDRQEQVSEIPQTAVCIGDKGRMYVPDREY